MVVQRMGNLSCSLLRSDLLPRYLLPSPAREKPWRGSGRDQVSLTEYSAPEGLGCGVHPPAPIDCLVRIGAKSKTQCPAQRLSPPIKYPSLPPPAQSWPRQPWPFLPWGNGFQIWNVISPLQVSESSSAMKSCFLWVHVCPRVGGSGMGWGTSHKLFSSLVTCTSQFKTQWQLPCRPGPGADFYFLLSARQKAMFHREIFNAQRDEMRKWTNKWLNKLVVTDRFLLLSFCTWMLYSQE